MSHPPPLTAGSVIAGKYAVVRVIGEGGMGVVYEATHLRLRQRVAVKMLQKEMLDHEIIVSRFEREARAAAQLRSRHTARVMDVDVTDAGLPYLVMEYLEGHDLETELGRRVRLPFEEAVDVVLQACAAMLEAHQLGIVHRDLKPANLFLARDDQDARARVVKVLDFGISKSQHETDAKLTAEDSVMGTAIYMSPEQVRGSGTVDQRSDLWALGVILYELTSGRPPWIGTPTQLAAKIVTEDPPDILTLVELPLELVAIIGKCLQRDVSMRFQDVRELAVALAELATPNGAGRQFADAVIAGRSASFTQISLPPHRDASAFPARALSEDRMRGPGTAPGWSQHDAPKEKKRPRSVLSAMLAAFAIGIVVLGGAAVAWWKLTTHAAPVAAVAVSTPSAPVSVPSPEVTVTAPPPAPVVASAVPTALAAPTSSARGARKGKAPAAPPPPAAAPAPQPTASSLPLLL